MKKENLFFKLEEKPYGHTFLFSEKSSCYGIYLEEGLSWRKENMIKLLSLRTYSVVQKRLL